MKISIVGKIMMAIIFVSLIGGISVGPAFGRNGDRGPQQRGWHDDRGRHDNRGWQGRRGWQGDRGRRVYRPYDYYHPVPVPSPGVSLFLPFPFDIR